MEAEDCAGTVPALVLRHARWLSLYSMLVVMGVPISTVRPTVHSRS